LEKDTNVGHPVAIAGAIAAEGPIDEALDALVPIGVQRAPRDDEQPAGVPYRASDQSAVRDCLGGIKVARIVKCAEAAEAADGGKILKQRVVDGNPRGVGEIAAVQRERDRERLIEDAPFPHVRIALGRRAHDVQADRDEIHAGGVDHAAAEIVVVGEPDTDRANLGGELGGIVIVVPDDVLQSILELAAQAPSGFNLQPWRFVVVRDPENRKRLQKTAMNQPKVGEAPVVIIAIGMKEESKKVIEEVLREGAKRGVGKAEDVPATATSARQFLDSFPMNIWVNRHTMIALTTMMLLAETYGFDTAPMEGFDPASVKHEFGIPDEAEVVALLAIGRAQEPDKPYPGRFPLSRLVSQERYGTPWEDPFERSDEGAP